MSVSIVSARLPTGDTPVCNVTLEPYVLIKRGETTVTADDIPEEGSPEPGLQLRSKWYRSSIPRGGAVCSVHPDKEASVQCTICLRSKVAVHLSYHCTAECFRSSWQQHREYHRQAHANGQENGLDTPGSKVVSSTMSAGGETWVEVSRSRKYTPASDDVGFVLNRVRPAPNLPVRHLVPLPLPQGVAKGGPNSRFTVLSYNMLADLYAKGDVYNHCPAWTMAWHYRKRNLLKELLTHRPDIMCLQEVQSDHFSEYLHPELTRAGYMGIYKKKTTEIFTGSQYTIDGCATFFRCERFHLVKKYEVEFNKAAISLADQMTNPHQKKATMNRLLKDNVALIAVLEMAPDPERSSKQLICVANTHIHANPELNDVKLWQVHTLLKGLEKIANSADIPMLVAGDFNSVPGSAAHSLLVKGRVEPQQLESSVDPLGLLRDTKLQHSLPLASAYAALLDHPPTTEQLKKQRARVDPTHREPLFTNLNRDFKATLDYVLYTRDSLAPAGLLELPAEAEVVAKPGDSLPNANWSSDHVCLMAEFQILQHKG
ncbi:phosphatase family [Scenedesmus sp. NREL 46B-D3]|nr:phosphatase family [Scenedesmus sp. NREL 46B-D3]